MDNLEAWSFGGSILTFLVPMLAFVAIMLALLVLGTKSELVPGRRAKGDDFPVTATRQPGMPVEADTTGEAGEAGKTAEPDKAASAG